MTAPVTPNLESVMAGSATSVVPSSGVQSISYSSEGPYVVAAGDSSILADATAGVISVLLPSASANNGRQLQVKRTDASANNVLVLCIPGDLIENAASRSLPREGDSLTVESDGTQWWITSTLSTRMVNTTLPLAGGGDLASDLTLTINSFAGDSGTGGLKGAVPAPAAGDAAADKFLKANGTWAATPAAVGGAGAVPVGGIIMWSGTIATIPATWALCDGTSNTPGPDLRDKFVVGAKQDDSGVAKSNILGSLSQSGGATGHSHSGHANLTHAGGAVADHTGFTHALAIANHPDLTHVALGSHPALSLPGLTHADVSLPGYTHPVLTIEGMTHAVQSIASRTDLSAPGATHAVLTIEGQTHAVQSLASRNDLVAAALTHADLSMASRSVVDAAIAGKASFASGTNRSGMTSVPTNSGTIAATTYTFVSHPTHSVTLPAWSISPASHPTFTASAPASHPTGAVTHPAWSISPASHPTFTASAPASHATAAGTAASHAAYTTDQTLTHGGVGTHAATTYGVHTITQPGDHGAAGTVTHAFTQPSDHTLSAHDSVSMVPSFFALAFIQRMT